MTDELVQATMDEAVRRGFAFKLGTVEDLHTGQSLGPVAFLMDEEGEHVATLASRLDLAELARFLGVLPAAA